MLFAKKGYHRQKPKDVHCWIKASSTPNNSSQPDPLILRDSDDVVGPPSEGIVCLIKVYVPPLLDYDDV